MNGRDESNKVRFTIEPLNTIPMNGRDESKTQISPFHQMLAIMKIKFKNVLLPIFSHFSIRRKITVIPNSVI